jgi:Zn-finger nucleic acid-binding protein
VKRNETQFGVELLPSPTAITRARSGVDEAELRRLVKEQVAEIMAGRDAIAFEPFFRSRQVAYELKRLQSVPEQKKFSVAFARYGCMVCETRKTIHAGNGMCPQCRGRWFTRLTQIIAEGMTGETAQPARGASGTERRLLPNRPLDAPHRTFYQRSSKAEKLMHMRVAQKLGVDPSHVRHVALGKRHSERVSAALAEESHGKNAIGSDLSDSSARRVRT